MTPPQLTRGVLRLNNIIREIDVWGKHLWAMNTATLTLSANTFVYTTSNGLPSDILELHECFYRDASASDYPLSVIRREDYEAIQNKTDSGDPEKVFIDSGIEPSAKALRVWPSRQTVNTQTVKVGSDGNDYQCVKTHTAETSNKPITGANYLLFWEATGGSGSGTAWNAGDECLAPEMLRLVYKRRLYDFASATENPDMPPAYNRELILRLAMDLGGTALTRDQKKDLGTLIYESEFNKAKAMGPQVNNIHNHAEYF